MPRSRYVYRHPSIGEAPMPRWFQVGTPVVYVYGKRRMTIVRIDEEKFRFHTAEPGVDKWLAFRWLDWTSFEPVPTVWDHIVKD